MGVDIRRECAGERRPYGNHVARTVAPRRLSLAMDSQLAGTDRH